MIPWINLTDANQIEGIVQKSFEKPQVIFKHSTSCYISSMAKRRMEGDWDLDGKDLDIYFLDLLKYRSISNQIAVDLQIHHESPQLILLNKGEVVYDTSHGDIAISELKSELKTMPFLGE